MPAGVINEQWRDENIDRRYPFADAALLTNSIDEIPTDLFLDARLYPVGGTGRVYLKSIDNQTDDTIVFNFSDEPRGPIGSSTLIGTSIPDLIHIKDIYGRPSGVLVPGPGLTTIRSWGFGEHVFKAAQTSFATRTQVPMPHTGLQGLKLVDNSFLSGDIWLIGEHGVFFSHDGGSLRIDLSGDKLALVRECNDIDPNLVARFLSNTALRTINGIQPNQQGDILIVVGGTLGGRQLLRITVESNGLRIAGVI